MNSELQHNARQPWLVRVLTGMAVVMGTMTSGCDGLVRAPAGEDTARIPAHVQSAFDNSCATSGCHDAGSRAGGLSLAEGDSAAILTARAQQDPTRRLVVRGEPEQSYLVLKMLPEGLLPEQGARRSGDRMPPGGPEHPEDIDTIVGWIAAGLESVDDSTSGDDYDSDGLESGVDLAVLPCSTAVVAPGSLARVETGPGVGQIPHRIGRIIENACGCHVANSNELLPGVARYVGPRRMNTFKQVHALALGAKTSELMAHRVLDMRDMPPAEACAGEGQAAMSNIEAAYLEDWLRQGAPDAQTWTSYLAGPSTP